MIKFIKKYSFLIIFLAITTVVEFYFYPAEEEKYAYSDIKYLEENRFYIIIITQIVLLLIIFFSSIVRSFKERNIKEILNMIATFSILILFFYTSTKPLFIGLELFLNRQKNIEEVTEKYILAQKSNIDGHYYLNWLMKPESDEFLNNKIKINKTAYHKLKHRDTVEILFKKGWLGTKHSPQLIKIQSSD
ncbi:hypothetical protein GCM10011344_44920 [Dokdonia pacifica]|uniref:Uncharacterized protein n=1 Tax=Dokdonia pacifica TaxID=1627892 RepID=A0A239CQ75_9FLAO|nr:hypothetical protein [Dokdonia pacifica]GGG39068.1 hypothetical protein GCM10011344_44920 [Dokdonia pacifica]SNS22069.1 hypothetical protein SAMN06265376_108122 [Dokdonia pacifica]